MNMPSNRERHFYLIPPTYFSIEYAINDWMDPSNQADKALAQTQWEMLFQSYKDLGVKVESFEAVPGLPDQVFPGDSVFLYGNHAVLSNFQVPERAGEVAPMRERFTQKGFEIHTMPAGTHFEGNAEAIMWNGKLLGGFGVRSDKAAPEYLSTILKLDLIPLEIKAPYFHLDMAICPLNKNTLAYVPDAFTIESRKRVEALDANLIPIEKEEGLNLACNSMSVNNTVILSTTKVDKFPADLQQAGFNVIALDLSEFAKSGGGAKCLTLEAYPEIQ
jgi:N-dimethylarginine dimethylaminohydrolase